MWQRRVIDRKAKAIHVYTRWKTVIAPSSNMAYIELVWGNIGDPSSYFCRLVDVLTSWKGPKRLMSSLYCCIIILSQDPFFLLHIHNCKTIIATSLPTLPSFSFSPLFHFSPRKSASPKKDYSPEYFFFVLQVWWYLGYLGKWLEIFRIVDITVFGDKYFFSNNTENSLAPSVHWTRTDLDKLQSFNATSKPHKSLDNPQPSLLFYHQFYLHRKLNLRSCAFATQSQVHPNRWGNPGANFCECDKY